MIGVQVGYDGGICVITNCINTGGIGGDSVGQLGKCTIISCINTGTISGEKSGGMTGAYFTGYGKRLIVNCYNTGNITGDNAGGIVGHKTSNNGFVVICNCYSLGTVSGANSGEITGNYSSYNYGDIILYNNYSPNGSGGTVYKYDGGESDYYNGTENIKSMTLAKLNKIISQASIESYPNFLGNCDLVPPS